MKKTLPILTLLLAIVTISACTNNSQSENASSQTESSIVSQPKDNVTQDEIKTNKTNWENGISSLKVVHDKSSISDYASFPTKLANLKKNNDYVISGTVTNLETMTDNNQAPMTKATIMVDNVLSGNGKLKKHEIKVIFNGGITTNDKSKQVFVEKSDTPIPSIGSKIITGITSNRSGDTDKEYAKYLKKNHLGGSDSFAISVPEYNLWIYDNNSHKYVLNNPQLIGKKVSYSNEDNAKKLKKLTKQINQNFNN